MKVNVDTITRTINLINNSDKLGFTTVTIDSLPDSLTVTSYEGIKKTVVDTSFLLRVVDEHHYLKIKKKRKKGKSHVR